MIYCVCGFRIVLQCLFVLITAPCAVRFPTQCGRYFIATIEFASDSPDYTIQSKPMLIPGLPQNLKNHYKIETRFTCRLYPIKIMILLLKVKEKAASRHHCEKLSCSFKCKIRVFKVIDYSFLLDDPWHCSACAPGPSSGD